MKTSVEVNVEPGPKGFVEDKDAARKLRTDIIMPALLANKGVIINLRGVTSATQSFVHALVGEPLQTMGEAVLSRLEFRSCAPQVRSLVELVVDYSLGGFSAGSSAPMEVETGNKPKKPSERPTPPKPRRKRG